MNRRTTFSILVGFSLLLRAFQLAPAAALPNIPIRLSHDPKIIGRAADPELRASSKGLGRWTPASQAPGDEFWRDEFGLPAIDGAVECAVIWNGSLIVGGQFYQVGGVATNNIARWDGTKWTPLGSGTDEQVLSLIVYDGDLIVGGRFTRAGNVEAAGIARWNGSEWRSMGSGLESSYDLPHVASLAIFDDDLVATGGFTHSGSEPLLRVAQWDGVAWHPLGEGLSGPGWALAVLGDSLFAGGSFDHAGSEAVSSLARWNGVEWTDVAGGVTLGTAPGAVTALAIHQNRLFVAGEFDSVGDIPARNIASWVDGTWSALAEGIHARVTCLASHQGSLVAGIYFGSEGIYQWNGSSWHRTAPMDYGYALTLLSSEAGLIVGGAFRANAIPLDQIAGFDLARWTGDTWVGFETWNDRMHGLSMLFGGSPYVQTVCVHDGEIVAGGAIDLAGDPPNWMSVGTVTSWDGSHWRSLLPESFLGQAYTTMSEGDTLYAGGHFYAPFWFHPSYEFGLVETNILKYAGGIWSAMDTLSATVNCLARFQGSLYLGATRSGIPGPSLGGLYRWDGVRWESIGQAESINPFYGVTTMLVHEGKLVVGGVFERIGGLATVNIATWDGAEWEPLAHGLQGDWFGVDDLTEWNGKLVAAGSFPSLPGGWNGAAVWNGESWERLGELYGYVYTIKNVRGRLYAGGWIGSVRQHLEGLLQFDGSTWSPVGSGVNGPVYSITELDDALILGGSFTRAGGRSSFGIAAWDGLGPAPPNEPSPTSPGVPTLSASRPNPFRAATHFSVDLPRSGAVRVSIHDIAGREIAVLVEGIQSGGSNEMSWNGQDRSGRPAATGLYFVRAMLPDGTTLTRKVLRIK